MLKSIIKNCLFYTRNLIRFMTKGGVVYVNVANLEPDTRFENKRVLITGGGVGLVLKWQRNFMQKVQMLSYAVATLINWSTLQNP